MGLFDFVKDAGERLLGIGGQSQAEADQETATALAKLVANLDLGVE